MGHKKAVADDLLADIPDTVNAQPSQSQSQPKPKSKRLKKAQPKATVTQINTEDTLPISKLAEAIEHSHSFVMQAFAIKKELANKTREAANLSKSLSKAEGKMKTFTEQAEAAKKAQDEAEEKADAAEAIAKVLTAEKKEAEAKMVEAQKKLQDALATKESEIKAIDEKAYVEGAADVKEDYKK
ncbi:uncharacterized protein LOC114294890 [Camellia sinensis]|uniref:uncharacterized protein LOC114294890 n=1 Tax=Camellia sinensis TaxID=4442 RepID=UPI001036CC7A|nr:uncharacterized protein LOC114294890 [Camellia sinensis]